MQSNIGVLPPSWNILKTPTGCNPGPLQVDGAVANTSVLIGPKPMMKTKVVIWNTNFLKMYDSMMMYVLFNFFNVSLKAHPTTNNQKTKKRGWLANTAHIKNTFTLFSFDTLE